MSLDRRSATEALEEIASLLELRGDNPFRVRAFANGARAVKGLPDFEERLAAGTLTEVKGIGKGLASELEALHRDGRAPLLDELRSAVPSSLFEIASVPGLGPKKARTLHDDHGLRSLAELEYACRENRLRGIKGFGVKTQEKVLASLGAMKRNAGRLRRDEAQRLEMLARDAVAAVGGRAVATGALRRGEVLCDGLDLVIESDAVPKALDALLAALSVVDVVARDDRGTLRALLPNGATLRAVAVPPGHLGTALLGATGPVGHLRALAARRPGPEGDGSAPSWDAHPWATEEDAYAALGLPWIPPELRGDGDEVERIARAGLPRLLERSDLLGAVHAHTTWSDGSGSVGEMLDAARAAGLRWLGLSDHSRAAAYAGGLTPERVFEQQAEIDVEAAKRPDLIVFKGTECDILGDGSLDYDDDTLRRFDFIVASVHSRFNMPREEMTVRVLRAVENPHTTVLGHPTGRLLLGREGFALDIDAVLVACARHGVAIELNAHPARLDLDPSWMPRVLELGVMVSIGPDAHEVEGFSVLEHGLAVARRAGLPPERVLNTRDAEGARTFFTARRARGGLSW